MWSDDEQSGQDLEEALPEEPNPTGFVRSALVFYGVMGCAALLWRMSTPGESILHPAASSEPAVGLVGALGAGAALGLVSIALSELLTRFTSVGEALADVLGEGLAGIGRSDAILLALASGTAEEMFFRGALQPAVGIFWASLAFGACHFLPRRELALWSLYAMGMGFAFGWLFEWTGQLAAPIAAHIVVNGINLPRLAERATHAGADGETDETDETDAADSPEQADTEDKGEGSECSDDDSNASP